METDEQIIAFLKEKGTSSTGAIIKFVGLNKRRAVLHYLEKLAISGDVVKLGKRPHVTYHLKDQPQPSAINPNNPPTGLVPDQNMNNTTPARGAQDTTESPGFWQNLCQKLKLDYFLIRKRYEDIQRFLYPAYDQYMLDRMVHSNSNIFFSLIRRVYDCVILMIAVLSVIVQGPRKLIAIGVLILFLIGGWYIWRQFHHAKQIETYSTQTQMQNQMINELNVNLSKTKDQLIQVQAELERTRSQLADSQNELTRIKDQQSGNQQEMSQIQQDKDRLANQLEQEKQREKQLQTLIGQLNHESTSKAEEINQNLPSQITMDQIVDLTKQGVSSADIINRIRSSHSTYHLILADEQYLRGWKVSEDVITAMKSTQ